MIGVLAVNCGGDIKFRHGIAIRVVKPLLKWKHRSRVQIVSLKNYVRKRMFLIPGSLRDSGRCLVFGWPEITDELKYYYPTNVLVTGFRHHLFLGGADDDVRFEIHE